MSKSLLLIGCSKRKYEGGLHTRPLPARRMYQGALFQLSLQYAEVAGLRPLILSAKYGFIDPDEIIEWYDQKMATVYAGPWPKGSGYYVGGQLYFGDAPRRFTPLLGSTPLSLGQMLHTLGEMIRERSGVKKREGLGLV